MGVRRGAEIYKGMAICIAQIRYGTASKWGLIHPTHKLSSYVSTPEILANPLNLAEPMKSDGVTTFPQHLTNAAVVQDVYSVLAQRYAAHGWTVL